jgi:hypothetical protein
VTAANKVAILLHLPLEPVMLHKSTRNAFLQLFNIMQQTWLFFETPEHIKKSLVCVQNLALASLLLYRHSKMAPK